MIECWDEKVVFIRCCLASQAEKLRDKMTLGTKCRAELSALAFRTVILETLMDYNNCCEENCLDEEDANTLLESLLLFCKKQCGYNPLTLTNQVIVQPETSTTVGGRIVT